MQPEQILGFGLILAGAICGGSFGLPSKYARPDTPWEVLWGPFFFIVTLLIPCTVAPAVVTDLGGIYTRVGAEVIVPVLIFGLLWGLGSMTLGMSFAFIGLSLAYALNYGAQIIFGSMMPLLIFDRHQILTFHGGVILAGVAVCVAGVVACGRAGILKDRSVAAGKTDAKPDPSAAKKPRILIGLAVGVLSGILCACYAVASGYAVPIGEEAAEVMVSPDGAAGDAAPGGEEAEEVKANPDWVAAWAVTAMILWGGAISSCLYCAVQLTRNKTWGRLVGSGASRVLLLAAAMAVLHDAAIFLFGLGWINLGDLGVPVGYPVFMSFAIIVGNVHGFRTGEWKGASPQSINWIVAGIALLIVGVCVLAAGLSMIPA